MRSLLQTYSCYRQASQSKLVNRVSFNAMDVCKDFQYNKKYVSFLNMIKLKISDTFIEINFNWNFLDHIQKWDQLFLS